MKIINPSYEILTEINNSFLKQIEIAGRTCYKSEDRITDDSAKLFVKKLIERGHEAMIECAPSIVVKFICNRGFTHELVRHRICSYAQESTRYCNYSKDKHNNEITFIRPPFLLVENQKNLKYRIWSDAMKDSEVHYLDLITNGCSPQEAIER